MRHITRATMLAAILTVTGCNGIPIGTGPDNAAPVGPLALSGVTTDSGDTVVNIHVGMNGILSQPGDATGVAFDMAYNPDQPHHPNAAPAPSQNGAENLSGQQATLSVTVDTGDPLTTNTLVLSLRFDQLEATDTDTGTPAVGLTTAGL